MFDLMSALTCSEMVLCVSILALVSIVALPYRDEDQQHARDAWKHIHEWARSRIPLWQPDAEDLQPLLSDAILPQPFHSDPPSPSLGEFQLDSDLLWPLLRSPRPLHRVAKAS